MLLHNLAAATLLAVSLSLSAQAAPKEHKQDVLIKLAPNANYSMQLFAQFEGSGASVEQLNNQWIRVESGKLSAKEIHSLSQNPAIAYIQPNYPIHLLEDYSVQDPLRRAAIMKFAARQEKIYGAPPKDKKYIDNPDIIDAPQQGMGMDPLFSNQWGMNSINVMDAWKVTKGSPDMIVAVIDTGVDYTHADLVANIWRNTKEIPNNGIVSLPEHLCFQLRNFNPVLFQINTPSLGMCSR